MADKKVQLTTGVDTTGVKRGFREIQTDAQAMGRTVAQAGEQAGRGLEKVGDGAEQAAQKLSRTERSFINTIQRLTAAEKTLAEGGKDSTAYLEERARQLGLNTTALRPYIQELDAARAANAALDRTLNLTGLSARQTAAALRGVPAQITDIVVSLQGGMNPLTVFLQQGGQLRDMFGGIGNAAKALGSTLLGLVTPWTAAAAAVAVLGFAYESGAGEARNFERALIQSGNAAGVTGGQLQVMAQRMSALQGTQSAAAAGLAEMARVGSVQAAQLESYTQAALQWQRVTGTAVADTAKAFTDLRKAPLEATLKLNESMGYLTAGTYAQIKALMDQGRASEAANVAQRAYADTLAQRAPQMEAQLGTLERAWLAVKGATAGAWDALKSVGRVPGIDAQLAQAEAQLAVLEKRAQRGTFGPGAVAFAGGPGSTLAEDVKAQREQVDALRETVRLAARSADEQARGVAMTKARAEWDKEGVKYLSEVERLERSIKSIKEEGRRAGASPKEIQDRIDAAKAEYAKKGAAGASDGINAQVEALRRQAELEEIVTRRAQAQLLVRQQLGQISAREAAEQNTALELQAIDRRIAAEQSALGVAARKTNSLQDQARIQTELGKLTEQRVSIEVEGANKLKLLDEARARQIAEVRVAQLEELQAARVQSITEALAKTNAGIQVVQEYRRSVQESIDLTNLEYSLIGRSTRERDIELGQYRVKRDLLREIARIESLGLPAEEQARRIAQVREDAARAAALVERQVTVAEWNRTADDINRALTDALMDGFDAGKGFAENLRETVVNMFKTMVLRPIVSAIVQPVGGGLAQAVGGLTGSQGGGALGTLANNSGLIGAAVQAYGGYAVGASTASLVGANAVGMLGGDALGALIAANGSWAGVSVGAVAAEAAAGAAAGATAAGAAAGASAGAAAGSAAAGGSSAAGAAAGMGPYGWIAAAAILAVMAFAGKGEKRYGGQYGINFEGDEVTNGRRGTTVSAERGTIAFLEGPSGGDYAGEVARKLITGTTQGINTLLKDLGSGMALTGFQAGLETSGKGRGGVYSGGTLTGGATFGESGTGDNYKGTLFERTSSRSPNAEEAVKNFATDMLQVTIQALQAATDLPKVIAQQLKGVDAEKLTDEQATELLNSINAQIQFVKGFREAIEQLPFSNLRDLSFDAATGLIAAAGGLEALNTNLTGYLSNYFTAEEQRQAQVNRTAAAFAALGVTMPSLAQSSEAARAQFRALVEGVDVSSEKGQQTYAGLIALQGAFAELTPVVDAAAEAARRQQQVLAEQQQLQRQLYQAQGNTAALRAMDLAALDESNRALQMQIWALQDQAAAAEEATRAADQVRSAWQSISDAVLDEVKRLRGEVVGTDARSMAAAQAQFAIATGQARAGDRDAAQSLPELSRALEEMFRSNAGSALELRSWTAELAASLLATQQIVAAQYGLKSESATVDSPLLAPPTSQAPAAAASAGNASELSLLRSEVAQLRVQLERVAVATEESAETLITVTAGGKYVRTKEVS